MNLYEFFSLNGGKRSMMIEDSPISRERLIECLIMERLENELVLTYVPCGQSTSMTKSVAHQILRNWLKIINRHTNLLLGFWRNYGSCVE